MKREAAWDTLTPRQVRMFTTTGAAGVYELQEGIHLICDGQEFDVWGSRVSSHCRHELMGSQKGSD